MGCLPLLPVGLLARVRLAGSMKRAICLSTLLVLEYFWVAAAQQAFGHPVHGNDSDVRSDAIRKTSSVVTQHDVVRSEKPSKVGGNDATLPLNPNKEGLQFRAR